MKKFNNAMEAEAYIDNLENYLSNDMTLEVCAKYTLQATQSRDIMYEYELDGTFELECEMRDVADIMATLIQKQSGMCQ